MPLGLTGDGDDGTALRVDDRATVEGGWGDGPDEGGLLWEEPGSPSPRVLSEENTDEISFQALGSERTELARCSLLGEKRDETRCEKERERGW